MLAHRVLTDSEACLHWLCPFIEQLIFIEVIHIMYNAQGHDLNPQPYGHKFSSLTAMLTAATNYRLPGYFSH